MKNKETAEKTRKKEAETIKKSKNKSDTKDAGSINYKQIKDDLDSCQSPIFFYDDDPDGFCSFIQLYKYKKEGSGFIVKDSPMLKAKYFDWTISHDRIFVLDKPMIDEDFIKLAQKNRLEITWIDHHPPQDIRSFNNVHYYNPKIKTNKNICTSWLCYNTIKHNLWIAMVGIIGDWLLPLNLRDKLIEQYPRLITKDIKTPEEALFNTEIGKIIAMVSFNLKGDSRSIRHSTNSFLKIKNPYELLDNSSEAANYIVRKYNKINEIYQKHLKRAQQSASSDGFLIYIYDTNKYSFTKELSNNLMYLYPNHFIIVGRRHNNLIKMSLRSGRNVSEVLKKSLIGIRGAGGGHPNACGAHVEIDDFDKFIKNIKENAIEGKSVV